MSRRRVFLLTLPVILLLAAGAVLWFAWPKKVALTVEVSASPGTTVKGRWESDGRPQDVTITGSPEAAKFVLEGRRLVYSLVSTDEEGEFRAWARRGEKTIGFGGSGTPPKNGIRGWVQSSWWGGPPEHWSEPFNRDQQEGWGKPPPWGAAKPSP